VFGGTMLLSIHLMALAICLAAVSGLVSAAT
jgi:hypothetical protein